MARVGTLIHMDEKLKRDGKRLAKDTGRSFSQLVRDCLLDKIEEAKRAKKLNKVLGGKPAKGWERKADLTINYKPD